MFFILSHSKATKKATGCSFSIIIGYHANGIGDSRKKLWGRTKETVGTYERNNGDKLKFIPNKKNE